MNNISLLFGGTLALSKAGTAEGTNPNTIRTTAVLDYAINGIMYQKAITDNIAVSVSQSQANNTTCLYGLDIDAAGTVSAVKGPEVATSDLIGNGGSKALELPLPPDRSKCRFCILRIVNTSGAPFTLGSVDLGNTGITDTFFDVVAQPVAPFQS